MSDRIKGFTVTLEADLRDDDAKIISDAIYALRGVESVAGLVVGPSDFVDREQIRLELLRELRGVLLRRPEREGRKGE